MQINMLIDIRIQCMFILSTSILFPILTILLISGMKIEIMLKFYKRPSQSIYIYGATQLHPNQYLSPYIT